jgi:hypothetical protein
VFYTCACPVELQNLFPPPIPFPPFTSPPIPHHISDQAPTMSDAKGSTLKAPGTTTQRLQHVANVLGGSSTATGLENKTTLRFEPDSESFPRRKDLPLIPGAPAGA